MILTLWTVELDDTCIKFSKYKELLSSMSRVFCSGQTTFLFTLRIRPTKTVELNGTCIQLRRNIN